MTNEEIQERLVSMYDIVSENENLKPGDEDDLKAYKYLDNLVKERTPDGAVKVDHTGETILYFYMRELFRFGRTFVTSHCVETGITEMIETAIPIDDIPEAPSRVC